MVQNKAQFDDRIRNLLALAEDDSAESRTLLFSHICDLFLQKRPMESENQIRMLIEIINELISDIDIGIRKELCDILLNIDNPPDELIKLISEDVVEVSGRLLEVATIDDEQLLYLIKYASDEHREHIGRRFGLSPLIRRELDKKIRQDNKLKEEVRELVALAETNKISLKALDDAEQNSTELNEDATANILEVLRSKKYTTQKTEIVTSEEETVEEKEDSGEKTSDKISLISRIIEKKIEEKEPDEEQPENDDIISGHPEDDEAKSNIEFKQPHVIPTNKDKELQSANDQNSPDELVLDHEAPQDGPTTISDEWFWEIDRYGNIKYLSENAQSIFLQSPDDLVGEDFLCLWRRQGAVDSDPSEFIALFEKRQPFRDEAFDFEMAPGIFQSHLLSAVATFDLENGRFTGFRGSAHLVSVENEKYDIAKTNDNEIHEDEKNNVNDDSELVLTSPISEEDGNAHLPEFSGSIIDENTSLENHEHDTASDFSHDQQKKSDNQDEVASELLHNLSHEFRTPLNAIIGFSQMIDNEMWGPVSEKYKKNTKDIINAANHLKEAVNNILDSAKLDAGLIEPTPESFSLKSVIQDAFEAISPILESREIKVTGIDDNIDVILYNDKHCIMLCLIKIITFATKQATIGDELRVSVLVNSNAQVRIEIPLLNQNIDESKAQDLFKKTYNLNKVGEEDIQTNSDFKTKIASGFGLSVAQDVAKLVGSSLSTMSENGKVTHVVLTISTYPA